MVKKQKSEQKANLYLLAIVAIVAVVAVVVLVLNASTGSLSLGESDLTGQALSSSVCPKVSSWDCPGGQMVFNKNTQLCTCITLTQIDKGTMESVSDCPKLCCSGDSPCSKWSNCYGVC